MKMNSPRINTTIKRFSLLVIMLSTAIIASLIVSGKAYADLSPGEQRFGDAVAAPLCEFLDSSGINEASLTKAVEIIYRNTPANVDVSDSVDIINYAVYNYCPNHWDNLVAFGEGARSQGA
jgi:hypothetical protein